MKNGMAMRTRRKQFKDNYPWTQKEILFRIKDKCCEVTGIPFDVSKSETSKTNPFVPSMDRIDPSLGYTLENTQFVCWIYNVMKSDFSVEDITKFIEALRYT